MTKVALLALLATAKIAAAPVYYKADILLTSAYRVLEWSRTPALFIHDEKHHEYRTPRVLAIPGKEHVLVDGVRIMVPGKPDHLDDRLKPGPVSAFPGRLADAVTRQTGHPSG
jgi:hypothetical protein